MASNGFTARHFPLNGFKWLHGAAFPARNTGKRRFMSTHTVAFVQSPKILARKS
jgi:hypothetical protein